MLILYSNYLWAKSNPVASYSKISPTDFSGLKGCFLKTCIGVISFHSIIWLDILYPVFLLRGDSILFSPPVFYSHN